MNRAIFDKYGEQMIESFLANVYGIGLTVYVEGFVLPAKYQSRVKQVPLSATDWPAFRDMCKPYPERSGIIEDVTTIGKPLAWKTQRENGQPYHFRLDAVKFSRKVFCLHHFCQNTMADVALLMDADTSVKDQVYDTHLLEMIPPEADIALLERDHEYSEAGFYMVNLRAGGKWLAGNFADLYLSGDVFELEQWHDSWVLDWVIRVGAYRAVSLSGNGAATNNPLANGPLGKWFDHVKGRDRKRKYRRDK
jgi:hypothetical protein